MVLVSAESNIVDQIVHDLPIPDTTGTHWIIYDVTDPQNRWTDEAGLAAVTTQWGTGIVWVADVGLNFPLPTPAPGDTLIVIGSWDSAYVNNPDTYEDNVNHTGFYWLFSDTLDDLTYNHWRDDTLRPQPKPAAGVWADSIEVSIKNPPEIRYPGQTTYDVLGYDLWVDSTGTGTPNSYDVYIAFFPIMDGQGDYTSIRYYAYDYYQYGQNYVLYHAYKLVAGPAFTAEQEQGHMTSYLSRNASPIDFPWHPFISERKGVKKSILALYAAPSPSTRYVRISYELPKTTPVTISIYILHLGSCSAH